MPILLIFWKGSSLEMLFLKLDMGLMCYTKHESVGAVGQIIPASYMWCFARFSTISAI